MAIRKFLGNVIRSFKNGQLTRREGGEVRRARPFLETLEAREVLATAPFVTAVSPLNGAVNVNTNTPFTVTVTYSETMSPSALQASNYILLDSSGNTLSFQGNGTFATTVSTNDTVLLTVSNTLTPLPVDSYSLFVRGDKVFDSNDNLPLAQAPQLIAANGGRNNVSVMTVNSDGTMGTTGNYIEPASGTQAANPYTLAFGDFDGDGIPDLAVVNAGTNTIALYQGKEPGQGGGYSMEADLTLTLPSVNQTNKVKGIAVGDLNKDGMLDIVVANEDSGKLSIFLNNRASEGTLSFAESVDTTSTLFTPRAVAIADVNGDGFADIIVMNNALDGSSNYTVSIFRGDGTGTFTAPASGTQVGTGTTGAQSPVGLAIGRFSGADNKLDIAVAGSNGVAIIENIGVDGGIAFAAPTLIYSGTGLSNLLKASPDATVFGDVEDAIIPVTPVNRLQITSTGHGLLVGDTVRLSGIEGFGGASVSGEFIIVARTANTFQVTIEGLTGAYTSGGRWERVDNKNDDLIAGSSSSVVYLLNNTQSTWVASSVLASAGAGGLSASGDLDNNHTTEFAFTNANATGQITIVGRNTAFRAIEAATVLAPGALRLTSTAHGLSVGDTVTLTGLTGLTGFAPGQYTPVAVTANTFDIAMPGLLDTTTYTGGGTWARSSSTATFSVSGTTVTVTSANHKLVPGTMVTVSGSTGGNGTYSIQVVDANSFTLTGAPTGGAVSYTGASYVVAGAIGLDPSGPYATGATATGIALGDTNGDGNLDVVTADRTANTFSLILGAGDRTLQANTTTSITPTTLRAIAYADLNNDGITDIALVNSAGTSANSKVTVLLGKADGTFDTPVNFTIGTSGGTINNIGAIAAVDLNGDGKLDIVVGGRGSVSGSQTNGVLAVLRNTSSVGGAVTFASAAFFNTGPGPTSIASGDFDGDGKLDLAISHNHSGGFGGGASSNRGLALMRNTSSGSTISFSNFTDGKTSWNEATDVALKTLVQGTRASGVVAFDFNKDGKVDLAVSQNDTGGNVYILRGEGGGRFSLQGTVSSGAQNLTAIAAGDLNNDGFVDLVVASGSQGANTGGISVLLNQAGGSFAAGARTDVNPGTPLASLVVIDANQDGKLDVVVGTALATGGKGFTLTQSHTANNIFVLIGRNDGSFFQPVPYFAGGVGSTGGKTPTPVYPPPTYLAVGKSPLIKLSTFNTGGNIVITNMVRNGNFEQADLTGEQGNLVGWTTYKLPDVPVGSHGGWGIQTGTVSPMSGVTVNGPSGKFQAMLDQANIQPFRQGTNNPNNPRDYAGSHSIYQDVFIPADAITAGLSLRLYLNSESSFSDTNGGTQILDYRTAAANQQVRVDLLTTSANLLAVTGNPGLLQNIFITTPTTAVTGLVGGLNNIDVSAYKGQTIRIRVAMTNNQGRLTVGLDNVQVNVRLADSTPPVVSGLQLRNPGFLVNGIPTTTDVSFSGVVSDNGGIANIQSVTFDILNDGFGNEDDITIINNLSSPTNLFDSMGNFVFKESDLIKIPKGLRTIAVRATDRAGNFSNPVTITFNNQIISSNEFMAVGPNGVATNKGYGKITGRVTAVDYDLSDRTGNTYYVGTANGGVWKTTNGGVSWTPLMDFLNDNTGNRIFPPIGSLAVSRTNPQVIYAGTGVADLSIESRLGTGVLKSTDGGKTWVRIGNSGTVLANSRISKILIDGENPDIVYAGVAAGGVDGPGVYKSTDGGLTWVNTMKASSMAMAGGQQFDSVASVTDMVIDPFNPNRLLVGLGNIGLTSTTLRTAGLWRSANKGGAWDQISGGDNTAISDNTLPYGTDVGTVKVAMGTGRIGDERFVYALMGTVPGNNTPPNVDLGGFKGLYKSSDNLLNWTKVSMKQETSTNNPTSHNFQEINFGKETSYASALVVDPVNANVVYVGGSRRYDEANELTHSLVRVDTGNMRDGRADPSNPGSFIANDGDDITKYDRALAQYTPLYYDPPPPPNGTATTNDPYTGEGVSWYDLEQAVINDADFNPLQDSKVKGAEKFPPTVMTLRFDALGRLLIGTNGGIWRAANLGVPYDFTSGGQGIVSGRPPSTPGFKITSLNGNLQIADLTSVAIDPTMSGMYYITTLGLGGASSLDPTNGLPPSLLTWYSESLTGPTIGVDTNNNPISLGIPNSGVIRVTSPAPGAPAGTPATLLRLWQYADVNGPGSGQRALYPERSGDFGETWDASNSAGIPTQNNSAGYFASLAVNPNKIAITDPQTLELTYVDEIILGTNRVFLTRSSGNVYDPISPILASGGAVLTAVALAPSSTTGYYYAGTSEGKVFVAANGGGLLASDWPDRSAGLPTGGTSITSATLSNGTITNAEVTATNTLRLSTTAGHGLSVGASVTLAGINGISGANGTFTINAVTATTFTVSATGVSGTYTNGGTWTRADRLTITSAGHGLGVGSRVTLAGINGITNATGTFDVTAVTANTFEVAGSNFGGTYLNGGTWTLVLPVQSISVDPNNPSTAYVAFGGLNDTASARVYKTTDGGLTWSNISSNLPRVPVYSIVLDRRPGLNAPNGKIYAATNLGVYVSTNEGTSWLRVGSSMPTAPVIDLQQDPTTGVMAAATQGRGLYLLSTNPITPLEDVIINEDTTTQPIFFSLNGLGVATNNLSATVISGNTTILPNSGISLVRNGINYTLRLTPAANQNGTVTITVRATDGTRVFTETFNLVVNPVDDAPVISAITPRSLVVSDSAGSFGSITSAVVVGGNTLRVTSNSHPLAVNDKVYLAGIGGISRQVNGTVTASATSNGTIQVTSANHGLLDGASVTISGLTGANSSGNGTYLIKSTGANTFLLYGAPTGISYVGAAYTANLTFNGEYTITAVTANTFDITLNGATGTYTSGGVWARTGNISNGIAINNGNGTFNVRVTSTNHGLATNNLVTTTGPGAGTYRVIRVDADRFELVNAPIGINYNGKFIAGVGTLAFTISDPDNLTGDPAAGLGPVTATSDNTTFIPNANIAVDGTGPNRILLFNIAPNTQGVANISLSVSDGVNTTVRNVAVVAPGNVTTPGFTDDFNRSDNVFLGAEWTDRAGDFQTVNNKAVAVPSGVSMVTLNGVALADMAVQADFTITAGSGKSAGLMARYSGPGTSNYYYAEAYSAPGSTSTMLSLYRNVNGTFVTLATRTIAGSASGVFRFEVVGSSLKLFLNDNLQVFAFDTVLPGTGATSSAGLRATGGNVAFDNFVLDPITTTTPTLDFGPDDFSTNYGSTRNQLTRDYVEQVGNVRVESGTARNNATTVMATLRGVSESDMAVIGSVSLNAGTGRSIGLVARYGGPAQQNFYYAELFAPTGSSVVQVNLYRNVNGAYTVIGTGSTVAGSAAGQLRFEVVGGSQKLFLNDVLVAHATDSTITAAGSAGFRMTGAVGTVTLDNFEVDKVTLGAAPTLDFGPDTFTTAVRQQLDRDNYVERAGNFKVDGGTATNNATVAMATLRDISESDMAVIGSVSLNAGTGRSIGLVARYSGPAQQNFYYAELFAPTGSSVVQVNLYRNVNGVYTVIGTGSTVAGSAVGQLRFEVVGGSQKLFLNDTLIAHALDGTITAAGSAGFRMTGAIGTVSIDDFEVDQVTLGTAPTLDFGPDAFATAVRQQLDRDNYVERAGNFKVDGGTATNNATVAMATLRGVSEPDMAVVGKVSLNTGTGRSIGLVARYSGPAQQNFYYAELFAPTGSSVVQVNLYRNVNGVFTAIGTGSTISGNAVGELRFEVVGGSQKLFLNDNLVAFALDGTITAAGSAGFRMTGAVGTLSIDDFEVDKVTLGTAPDLPFSDSFSTAERGQLSRDSYVERLGNFKVDTGTSRLLNNSALAIATLRSLNEADMTVSVDVNVPFGTGRSVGLLARYNGTGEGNGYLVEMYSNPGSSSTVQVAIYRRNTNGTLTTLASGTTTDNVGTLEFVLSGTSLTLKMNGNDLLTATDSTFTTGSAGLRLSGSVGTVGVTNFNVS